MGITKLEPVILHAPVTGGAIADSTHHLTHWGAPGVAIHTDSGHVGYGFSGTHAHLPTDRLITDCIVGSYGPCWWGRIPLKCAPSGRRCAHLACTLLEYIPWLRDWMENPAQIRDGY